MNTRSQKTRFTVNENRRLTFYAALFNTAAVVSDRTPEGVVTYRESILPGAFADSLALDDEVIACIDHDPTRTFATRSSGQLLLQEDPHGLFASCYLPETDLGNQVMRDVQSGILDGTSFRFAPIEDRKTGDLVERVRVKLADVTLTATPAYPQTTGEVHLRSDMRLRSLLSKFRLLKIKSRMLNNNITNNPEKYGK